jgi:hypothetical protein
MMEFIFMAFTPLYDWPGMGVATALVRTAALTVDLVDMFLFSC